TMWPPSPSRRPLTGRPAALRGGDPARPPQDEGGMDAAPADRVVPQRSSALILRSVAEGDASRRVGRRLRMRGQASRRRGRPNASRTHGIAAGVADAADVAAYGPKRKFKPTLAVWTPPKLWSKQNGPPLITTPVASVAKPQLWSTSL